MIIDANVHITATGEWFGSSLRASVHELIRQMDEASVDKAVVIPLPGVISNEENLTICASYADRLISGSTFNPAQYSNPDSSYAAFHSMFNQAPFPVVKFHNRFGNYPADDDRFFAALHANASLESPLVVMVCSYLNGSHTGHFIDAAAFFFNLAKQFPTTNFIVAHGGGFDLLRVIETCKALPNIYFDLSYTICRYQETAIDAEIRWLCSKYDRRILWGSDFPEVSPVEALKRINLLTENLHFDKRENICGNNIKQLYAI